MPEPATWSQTLPSLIAALAFGYALGSLPFGLLLTRLFGAGDVREIGSGNIGATNVLRTGRKGLAATTLAADLLKGTLAVLLAGGFGMAAAFAAGFGAFIGHILPLWLRFRGGKGVATYLGVLAGLHWPVALGFCAVWLAVAFLSRYSSLSALAAAAATPVLLALAGAPGRAALFLAMGAILFLTHRDNIARLVRGEETRIELTARRRGA